MVSKIIPMKKRVKAIFQSEASVFVILIVLCSFIWIIAPEFLNLRNISNVLQRCAIIGTVALGQTMIILTAGIDLSIGGAVVLISTTGATFLQGGAYSIGTAIMVMLLLGFSLGAINGAAVSLLNFPPFIVTLGMMNITRGLALHFTQGVTIFGFPDAFSWFGLGSALGIPVPIWTFGILSFLFFIILRYTGYGRKVYAVGDNENAAWLAGVRTKPILFSVYSITGMLCAISAVLLTSRLDSAPLTMGIGMELDSIAAVVIGGTSLFGGEGQIFGTIVGALIIVLIENAMNLANVSPFLQFVVKGAVILFAVLLDLWRKGQLGKRMAG